MTIVLNKAQASTLAMLTRTADDPAETWEVEETNMEGVIALREYKVKEDLRDVLIAADGNAVALGDGSTKTLLLTDDGPNTR